MDKTIIDTYSKLHSAESNGVGLGHDPSLLEPTQLNSGGSSTPRRIKYPKPRISDFSCLTNLDDIVSGYERWVKSPEYLWFKVYDPVKGKTSFQLSKASKRGNDRYAWRMKKTYPDLFTKDPESESDKKPPKYIVTDIIYGVLEYNKNLYDTPTSWQNSYSDLNALLHICRKKHIAVGTRSNEAMQNGRIHQNLLFQFPEKMICERHWSHKRNQYVYYIPDEVRTFFKENWKHGYVDVQGVKDARSGLKYAMKYTLKNNDYRRCIGRQGILTLALNTAYRKRSFYISKPFLHRVRRDNSLHIEYHESRQSTLFGGYVKNSYEYTLLGSIILRKNPKNPPWDKRLDDEPPWVIRSGSYCKISALADPHYEGLPKPKKPYFGCAW